MTHTNNGITKIHGIIRGPGRSTDCASTEIFTRVSAPEIRNWILKIISQLRFIVTTTPFINLYLCFLDIYFDNILNNFFSEPCEPNPCLNGGSCKTGVDFDTTVVCTCSSSFFSGNRCQYGNVGMYLEFKY